MADWAVEKVFFNHKARPAEAVRTGTLRRHKARLADARLNDVVGQASRTGAQR